MNPAAFDALIDRLDAEIAEGPLPPRKVAAAITVGCEDIGPWRPRLEDEARTRLEDRLREGAAVTAATGPNRRAAFTLQPSRTDLLGMGITPDPDPCPPRPPEPPPAMPQRSWVARLLRRNR